MAFTWWWYPSQQFEHEGRRYALKPRARTDGLVTLLHRDGALASEDKTPLTGTEAVRNHRHTVTLPDGRTLDVEAGYVGLWKLGAHARVDGATVHESDPGRELAYPEPYRTKIMAAASPEAVAENKALADKWKRNRLPLAVDIGCSLAFFGLAKAFGLTAAALVMAGVGVLLVVAQRVTKLDFTGGLAIFGIAVSLLGAAYAWFLRDEELIKLRGTIIGCLTAGMFLVDGLFGGRRLAGKLLRYMPYDDMDAGRLGIGMGVMGLAMAGLNYAVVRLVSTDTWLFYTTFLDLPLVFALMFLVFRFARGGTARDPGRPGTSPTGDSGVVLG